MLSVVVICVFSKSRQIWHRFRALDKPAESRIDGRLRKEFAKNIDLPPQLLFWNRLNKALGRNSCLPVELRYLSRRVARQRERLAFRCHLADQANGLRLGRIEAAAR